MEFIMKQVIVLCSLLSCLCTSAVASITLHDVEKRVAFDGANTVVAITAGVTSTSNPGYYALHYSTDFGKTWQNVTSGDEECVLGWYRDAHDDTYESFNSIRYVAGK